MSDPIEPSVVPETEEPETEDTEVEETETVTEDPAPMPAEYLTFADGTVVTGHILEDGIGLRIYVYLDGMSLADGFALMNDTMKTNRIVAMNHGVESVYEDYTEIAAISTEFGNCNLVMKKAVA